MAGQHIRLLFVANLIRPPSLQTSYVNRRRFPCPTSSSLSRLHREADDDPDTLQVRSESASKDIGLALSRDVDVGESEDIQLGTRMPVVADGSLLASREGCSEFSEARGQGATYPLSNAPALNPLDLASQLPICTPPATVPFIDLIRYRETPRRDGEHRSSGREPIFMESMESPDDDGSFSSPQSSALESSGGTTTDSRCNTDEPRTVGVSSARYPSGMDDNQHVSGQRVRTHTSYVAPVAPLPVGPSQASYSFTYDHGGSSTQMAACDHFTSTNWEQYRDSREIRGGRGQTVWYRTSGRYDVCCPPSSLQADADELYIHCDERTSRSRIWVINGSNEWIAVRQGDKQPSNPERRLWFQRNGDPSWVTKETWSVYRSRQRKGQRGPTVLMASLRRAS